MSDLLTRAVNLEQLSQLEQRTNSRLTDLDYKTNRLDVRCLKLLLHYAKFVRASVAAGDWETAGEWLYRCHMLSDNAGLLYATESAKQREREKRENKRTIKQTEWQPLCDKTARANPTLTWSQIAYRVGEGLDPKKDQRTIKKYCTDPTKQN